MATLAANQLLAWILKELHLLRGHLIIILDQMFVMGDFEENKHHPALSKNSFAPMFKHGWGVCLTSIVYLVRGRKGLLDVHSCSLLFIYISNPSPFEKT